MITMPKNIVFEPLTETGFVRNFGTWGTDFVSRQTRKSERIQLDYSKISAVSRLVTVGPTGTIFASQPMRALHVHAQTHSGFPFTGVAWYAQYRINIDGLSKGYTIETEQNDLIFRANFFFGEQVSVSLTIVNVIGIYSVAVNAIAFSDAWLSTT